VLHTFRAGRFEDAMAQVKRALGPDALIVSRKQLAAHRGANGAADAGVEITAMSGHEAGAGNHERHSSAPASLLERRLVRDGVPESAARVLVDAVRKRQSGPALGMAALQGLLGEVLADEVMFGGAVGEGPRVVSLIGPTGVGKTTTIAKIAAHEELVAGRRVGLVSIDQYRIGGVDQLQRYADLIGCPMEVASDAASLARALRRLAQADLVLVDTAGRSMRDTAAFQSMTECLHGAGESVEVHLCLPVAMRERELSLAIASYAVLQPVRIICTKVDEALCCGSIVAAHVRSGLPLSYFTTGQRVPEDITPANPKILAALLCGGDIH
jgi:flagellar biosynthesis protein FlhF